MKRGFKSRCEEMSKSLRAELRLGAAEPLTPNQLASYLDVSIWPVTDLGLENKDLKQLLVVDGDSWSAITVSFAGRDAIVTNPRHRKGRFSSDVMHELAHLLLGHEPTKVYVVGGADLALREYDQPKEREADWLAGALLLPRGALLAIAHRNLDDKTVSREYGVSRQMLRFRLNVTGVRRQVERQRRPDYSVVQKSRVAD